jgi:acetoin utilization deacetylase AcuC-like enzyme
MTTFLFMPPQCFEHDTGYGHPECSDRLRAIESTLAAETFAFLMRVESGPATREQLERAHDSSYVTKILAHEGCEGQVNLDEDTVISSGSVQAALYGAGAACLAVDEVVAGHARNAFCAIRPPGHHAEAAEAMGFCLFNNAAIAALQAKTVHGVSRIAVIDFDVHHGNGVQSILWNKPDMMYISLHEEGGYPNTGTLEETGVDNNVVNALLHTGAGSAELRQVWTDTVKSRLQEFAPEFVIICAGFDAHHRDYMSGLNYSTTDFAWITEEIVKIANTSCKGRVVSLLEGGYEIPALAAAVGVHVKVLMEV